MQKSNCNSLLDFLLKILSVGLPFALHAPLQNKEIILSRFGNISIDI